MSEQTTGKDDTTFIALGVGYLVLVLVGTCICTCKRKPAKNDANNLYGRHWHPANPTETMNFDEGCLAKSMKWRDG